MADDQQNYPRASTPPPGPPRHRGPGGLFGRPIALAVAAAIAVGVSVGAILGVFSGDSDGPDTATAQPPTSPAASESPSVQPSETPSAEPPTATATITVPGTPTTPGGSDTIVVPVYYVGRATEPGGRHYLFREFRQVQTEGGSDPAAVALQAMLSLPPLDPDYTSPWPAGASLVQLGRSGDTATVVLSAEVAAHRTDADTAALAAQQLVYTVTAADRTVQNVRLVVGDQETTSLFGHAVGTMPLSRGPEVEWVSPVWIIDPYEGAEVGSAFTVYGTANVFEATVNYEVRRGSTIVREGTAQATSGGGTRGEWSVQLRLPAGRYVVRAFESSAENGRPIFVDSKTVTIG